MAGIGKIFVILAGIVYLFGVWILAKLIPDRLLAVPILIVIASAFSLCAEEFVWRWADSPCPDYAKGGDDAP